MNLGGCGQGLVDVAAVERGLAALEEFDRIGRSAFLEKYGFGEAKSYFIRRNGRRAYCGRSGAYRILMVLDAVAVRPAVSVTVTVTV